MTKNVWKKRIKSACIDAGTYRPFFDQAIETLADILVKRDDAQKIFEESGGTPIVTHTNKAGKKNLVQHPALRLICDLNRDALSYWRDLGLTPAGLKKINEESLKPKKISPLAAALQNAEK